MTARERVTIPGEPNIPIDITYKAHIYCAAAHKAAQAAFEMAAQTCNIKEHEHAHAIHDEACELSRSVYVDLSESSNIVVDNDYILHEWLWDATKADTTKQLLWSHAGAERRHREIAESILKMTATGSR